MLESNVLRIAETFVLFFTVTLASSQDVTSRCLHAKLVFDSKGVNLFEIPEDAVPGERLNVCSGASTCCTLVMERYLFNKTSLQFHDRVLSKMREIHQLFDNVTSTFDHFFVNLLDSSLVEMHNMLVQKYGLLYEQNSRLFLDLFNDLKAYFKTGSVDLSDAFDIFFEILFQRVFVLFNTQYTFDEAYEDCVAENIETVAPFGNIPRKLSSQVKESFVAARMFVRALVFGRDVMVDMMRKLELLISAQCSRDLLRLHGCQYCELASSALPCHTACNAVVSRCFAGLAVFSQQWDVFIRQLVLLAKRLEGPLNIERVVEPIEMKLSEAITNFQENSIVISSKVFEVCGQPLVGAQRKRRATAEGRPDHKAGSAPWPVISRQTRIRVTSESAPTAAVADVVRSIRLTVGAAFGFWDQLPRDECLNFTTVSSAVNAMCWNGTSLVRHSSAVMNTAVHISQPASSVIHQQLFRLIAINNRMNKSRLRDDNWNEGYSDNGSGEASGDDASGSGEILSPAYVNDLWQFASNTTHSPLSVPRSGVAKQQNHLFTVSVDIVCLIIIGTMSYC